MVTFAKVLFLKRTFVHYISKQVCKTSKEIYWSAGKLFKSSAIKLFFTRNCLFIYFISFFKL